MLNSFHLFNPHPCIHNLRKRIYAHGLLQSEMTLELDMLKSQISAGLGDPEQANQFRERVQELEKLVQSPQHQPLGPVLVRMCVGAVGGFGLAAGVAALVKNQKK